MTVASLQRVATAIAPIVPSYRDGRFVAEMTCAICGRADRWTAAVQPRASVILKKIAARGWRTGRRLTCPTCTAKPKEKPVSKLTVVPTPDAPEPSGAAKRVKRLIYMALEDYYDDDAKRYRDGHSDASIATEVGASEKYVATIRETDFGPLAEPSEVAEVRTALAGAIKDMAALQSAIGALTQKLNAVCARNGWKQH